MRKFIIILISLLFSVAVYAQDLPDSIMNWCDDDGPFAGQCTIPGDEALTNYLWELGWYLAAVDRGEITADDIPDRYKSDADFDEETASNLNDSEYGCDTITLPGLPDSATTVTGELVYQGNTYNSATIPSATYEAVGEGQEFDPSIIGGKYKVKVVGKDGGGDTVGKKTYKFKCKGPFDETGGGVIPAP